MIDIMYTFFTFFFFAYMCIYGCVSASFVQNYQTSDYVTRNPWKRPYGYKNDQLSIPQLYECVSGPDKK